MWIEITLNEDLGRYEQVILRMEDVDWNHIHQKNK